MVVCITTFASSHYEKCFSVITVIQLDPCLKICSSGSFFFIRPGKSLNLMFKIGGKPGYSKNRMKSSIMICIILHYNNTICCDIVD